MDTNRPALKVVKGPWPRQDEHYIERAKMEAWHMEREALLAAVAVDVSDAMGNLTHELTVEIPDRLPRDGEPVKVVLTIVVDMY